MGEDASGQVEDLRVLKTRIALHSALIALLRDRDLSKITVADITQKALVNRKTFYKHYADKYALTDELVDEAMLPFEQMAERRKARNDDTGGYASMVNGFYGHLHDHSDEMLVLWEVPADKGSLRYRLGALLKDAYIDAAHARGTGAEDLDFETHLFSELVLASVHYTLHLGCEFSMEYVSRSYHDVLKTIDASSEG